MAVRWLVAGLVVVAVFVSGCGGSSDTVEETEQTASEVEPTSLPEPTSTSELSSASEPDASEDPVADGADADIAVPEAESDSGSGDVAEVAGVSQSSEVRLRTGKGTVSALVMLSDGMVASGGLSDGTVQVWNPVAPGRAAVTVFDRAFAGSASGVGELGDGRLVVAGLSARVRIVDRGDPSALPEFYAGHRVSVTALTVLDDGHVVSLAGDTAHRWHPDDPSATVATYDASGIPVTAVAGFVDGRVATNNQRGGEVTVWSRDGSVENVFECGCGAVTSLASIADGGVVAAGTAGVVVVDPDDGVGPSRFVAALSNPQVAVFDDGRVAVADGHGRVGRSTGAEVVHVWNPSTGDSQPEQFAIGSRVHAIAVGPNQDLVVGVGDGVLVIDSVDPTVPHVRYGGHELDSYDIVELGDGRIVAGLGNGEVGIWDRSAGEMPQATYAGHGSAVYNLVLLEDGKVVSATSDGEIQVWHPDDPLVTLGSHSAESVVGLAVTGDGGLVVATATVVEVRDVNNLDTVTSVFSGHGVRVNDVIALSDGRVASIGADRTVQVWDPATGGEPVVFTEHLDLYVSAVSELSGGRIASGTLRGPVHVWHPDAPSTTIATFKGLGSGVFAIRELPDGRIASAGDSTVVHIWETGQTATDQAVSYNGHRSQVRSLVVLSSGEVASAAGDGIHIWDANEFG